MIQRTVKLDDIAIKGKVTIIYGPRRTGKTTMLHAYLEKCDENYKVDSGDNILTQNMFERGLTAELLEYAQGYTVLAIDEAQRIEKIGIGLKIIIDNRPDLKILISGSSSFNIEQKTGEPLTGRKRTVTLYPFSQAEMLARYNTFELRERLNEFLIFGLYPDAALAQTKNEKILILNELVQSYLLRDVLMIGNIRGARQLVDLLKLLALRIGSEVSVNELATNVGMDVKTIQRYIHLLEQGFVIRRLTPFSRNLRKEITMKNKYYFYDNGIRNALLGMFGEPDTRNDAGMLFENFFVIERMKRIENNGGYTQSYFWRTHSQHEIDLIEERDGKIAAHEIKWSEKTKVKVPSEWRAAYRDVSFHIINRTNYLEYLLR